MRSTAFTAVVTTLLSFFQQLLLTQEYKLLTPLLGELTHTAHSFTRTQNQQREHGKEFETTIICQELKKSSML